eukprot:359024-Chlamydomonas_euryale.AAC.3
MLHRSDLPPLFSLPNGLCSPPLSSLANRLSSPPPPPLSPTAFLAPPPPPRFPSLFLFVPPILPANPVLLSEELCAH